ncbi:uncharacterized protein LOC128759089 isoform X1 [Synchiropus splendidus]|uniref:uncharacterized protein LOC128759089 isoform X1 n=1 Tax=Synchiropus splendidus TaxID=270530 RepID=UPI00237E894F|nr:uncharacterized protein LOC128759089 isoform X1 [Synchiropus splendidus]
MLLLLLISLLLVSPVAPSHYMASMSKVQFKGKDDDGNWLVIHHQRQTFEYCSWESWNCFQGNCGSTLTPNSGIIDQSSTDPDDDRHWCENEKIYPRVLEADLPFTLRVRTCCWIDTQNDLDDMTFLATVDLGERSDTTKPNDSPDICILPYLRVPQNCPRSFQIHTLDPEGDAVRCRYGKRGTDECYDCLQNSGFVLHEDTCVLDYQQASSNTDPVGFELVVEEYPQQEITLSYTDGASKTRCPHGSTNPTPPCSNTDPLSRHSLQLVVKVDPAVSTCTAGEFIPALLSPTPDDGDHITAEVDKELEILIEANAQQSTVHDVIFSGHQNFTKHKTTSQGFALRWTPIIENKDEVFTFCFAVESLAGSRVFHSEMRCVIIDVIHKILHVAVSCSPSTMTVAVHKNLPGISEEHFALTDPTNAVCSLLTHSNNTHIIASFPLNSCGTEIEEDNENLLFKNTLTAVDQPGEVISRKDLVHLDFHCKYSKHGVVSQGFSSHRESVTVSEEGFGTFIYQFEFYEDNSFTTKKDPSLYPLEYEIGSKIYMQIDTTSAINTELFVESCKASPYDNPNYTPTYSIIENGCNVDSTVVVSPTPHSKQFRFFMDAFRFIGVHEQVYISCSVLVCEVGNANTRCSQGCITPKVRVQPKAKPRAKDKAKAKAKAKIQAKAHNISKREADFQTSRHFISQGPLRLKRSAEVATAPDMNLNLNLNLVFIVGALLAAVATVSVTSYLKRRISYVKYQQLSSSEL